MNNQIHKTLKYLYLMRKQTDFCKINGYFYVG